MEDDLEGNVMSVKDRDDEIRYRCTYKYIDIYKYFHF